MSVVSRVTADLLRQGVLLASADDDAEGPGRPAERLAVNPDAGGTIGAELADERLRLVSCDATGRLRAVHTTSAANDVSREALEWISRAIARWHASPHGATSRLLGVGVALHDVVTADGGWMRAGAPTEPLAAKEILQDALGVPVLVEDVSRAFADAERRLGAGRDAPDIIYLFLGRDGVGSGIFAGGTPLRSSTGICGEIGHVPVVPDGARCTCGNRGCLETVATHGALLGRARDYLDQGVGSAWRPDAGFRELMHAARAGDKVATLVLHDLARRVGTALTGAISITGATTILLGGQIRASGPGFPALLHQELRRSLLQPLANRVEVRYAELPETAGAHGIAMAALESAIRSGLLATARDERGVVM